jgi:hypoxanthine phosphoribosyltransferase
MCVLKGGYRFFSDLVSKIQNENRFVLNFVNELCIIGSFFSLRNDRSLPMSLEFIRTRSYINDHSTNQLEIIGLSDLKVLKNKDLLIIEDIIDTGATMVELKKELEKFQPKTIHVVSLLTKRRQDKNCVFRPDYSGFEIPDHFVVGYALVRIYIYTSFICFEIFCFRIIMSIFGIWNISVF